MGEQRSSQPVGRWTGGRSVIGRQTGRKSAGGEMGCKPGRPVRAMQRSQPAQPEAGGWATYRLAGGRAGRARQAEKQIGRWSGSHEGWGTAHLGQRHILQGLQE